MTLDEDIIGSNPVRPTCQERLNPEVGDRLVNVKRFFPLTTITLPHWSRRGRGEVFQAN